MELTKKRNFFSFIAVLLCMVFMFGSCTDDVSDNESMIYGKVKGVVTDVSSMPIEGVTVVVDESGLNATEGGPTAVTDSKGEFILENVSIGTHIITFKKNDYQTVSITVVPGKFNSENVANISAVMQYAAAEIRGTVTDASNADSPLSGVKVSISPTVSVLTDDNGTYVIDNLPLSDYTVTFAKDGFTSITKNVTIADFNDGIAVADARMGATEILRGLTAEDLQNAEKWYYNEYRGGRNSEQYPHWDWACDYMCTLDFRGDWEEQNEGTTLRIRNDESDRQNPADLEMFDSFVFGSKLITSDNNIMTLQVRTHNADNDSPTTFGVQVVDLSESTPMAQLIGGIKTLASEDYVSFDFDLSAYIGKEVIIAIGTFRAQTGDYWKQLVLRRIAFAKEKVEGWGWLPGTKIAALDGWEMTEEMVRSTMPQTRSSFTGISNVTGNRDNYVDAYRAWRGTGHFAAEWSFMPVQKDPELFPSEGYLIKTKGSDAQVSTTKPQSYFYAKFSIADGSNKLKFSTRNFSDNSTFFKITAITEDINIKHLSPVSHIANSASSDNDGCWKFVHQDGGAGSPDKYATFEYDLSEFNGQDVLIAIGVYKGESNGDENKLVLHSLTLE